MTPHGRAVLGRLWRFACLSGLGWLLDLAILLGLVGGAGLAPFTANVISSSTAALSVFLLSRLFIFERDRQALAARVGLYLAYTLCVILIAAAGLRGIVGLLSAHIDASQVLLAGIAKVIVTPPQLLLNFAVARFMSERRIGTQPWPTRS